MMYSDYYAISSCAFSVLFIPFMILATMHFCRVLQAYGYHNRPYLKWIGCSFVATVLPLIMICGLAIMAQFSLRIYLTNTYFEELNIIIGYAAWLLLASICIAVAFARYAKAMGRAMWFVPRIADGRMQILFICSSLVTGFLALVFNLFAWREWIYGMPLLVPFLAPLINSCMKRTPGPVRTIHTNSSWDESFAEADTQ